MTAPTPFPTIEHALATLDAFPILGGTANPLESTSGVDYDALVRTRALYQKVWRADLPPAEIRNTPQGGLATTWRANGATLELVVDPFALYEIRFDSPTGMRDWTRGAVEAVISDLTSVLTRMAERAAA